MTVKSTNIPEINCHLWAVLSNLRAKPCTITQPTAGILCACEVCFPLKLIAWNYGYTTRTQPKIVRTKLKFSENSPSYELPPCCDVMGLSNLITVPDWLPMDYFETFPDCSLPSTVSKNTIKIIGHHSRLRDAMAQSYLICACTRANHARYSSV